MLHIASHVNMSVCVLWPTLCVISFSILINGYLAIGSICALSYMCAVCNENRFVFVCVRVCAIRICTTTFFVCVFVYMNMVCE